METIQTKIAQYSNEIECFSKLMTLLISLKHQFSLSERQFLQSFLCPEIKDGIEQVIRVVQILFYFVYMMLGLGGNCHIFFTSSVEDNIEQESERWNSFCGNFA